MGDRDYTSKVSCHGDSMNYDPIHIQVSSIRYFSPNCFVLY